MAGAQRSDDDVDGVGKLRAKLFLAAAAQEPQRQRRQGHAADKSDDHRLCQRSVSEENSREHRDHSEQNKEDQTTETDGEP